MIDRFMKHGQNSLVVLREALVYSIVIDSAAYGERSLPLRSVGIVVSSVKHFYVYMPRLPSIHIRYSIGREHHQLSLITSFAIVSVVAVYPAISPASVSLTLSLLSLVSTPSNL